jgi:hypothetical protein
VGNIVAWGYTCLKGMFGVRDVLLAALMCSKGHNDQGS